MRGTSARSWRAARITRQAIQLLLLPPTDVRHTSKSQEGQIYVPMVNRWMLLFSVILVLAFQTSDNLGAAYGLAVTGVMVTSTIMLALVALIGRRFEPPGAR